MESYIAIATVVNKIKQKSTTNPIIIKKTSFTIATIKAWGLFKNLIPTGYLIASIVIVAESELNYFVEEMKQLINTPY